tara:strand:+ start:4307 stop:4705 length:399 start_codon:yes stop_codon:yes gene_type:complete
MKTQKQFILDTLLPYKEDPTTCGYEVSSCLYLTGDGKKCAVGKHLITGEWQNHTGDYNGLIDTYNAEDIFTQEALDQKLPSRVWRAMQFYHDNLALGQNRTKEHIVASDSFNRHITEIENALKIELTELRFN